MNYNPGQVIRFTYNHTRLDEDSGDRHKEVLVLHPRWQGKLHAIDLKRLTAAEREVLEAIFDPKWKTKRHRLPLVNDILRRMDPIEDVKNPMSFYQKFVKVFLRNKDAYRQYFPTRMVGVTTVKISAVKGNVFNPKPLFHKVASLATQSKLKKTLDEPEKPKSPEEKRKWLDAIRKKAVKLFGQKGADITGAPKTNRPTGTKKPTPATPAKGSMQDRLNQLKAMAKKGLK